jgi:DNA-binding transcriptional LysR family regulator
LLIIGAGRATAGRMSAEAGFELRQLRTFVSVAQRRSFTKAAEDLHIAQQAVSQQVKALERSLGVALLTRSRYTTIRREVLRVAISAGRSAEAGPEVELSSLRDEQFEIWPRKMAPGFYDAVVGARQAAGFEPRLDERAGGNTVWGYIARGLGVALVNGSLAEQLPSGIRLLGVSNVTPALTIQALWRRNDELPALDRALNAISRIAARERWL